MHFCLHICKITLEGYVQKQTMHALWEGNWCGWVAKDGRETSLWLLLYPLTLNHLYWLLEKQNCIKIVNTWKYYWFTKKLDAVCYNPEAYQCQSVCFPSIYTGVFNTSGGSHLGQNSSTLNGGDVINLRPNKQRTKKNRNPFSSCSIP